MARVPISLNVTVPVTVAVLWPGGPPRRRRHSGWNHHDHARILSVIRASVVGGGSVVGASVVGYSVSSEPQLSEAAYAFEVSFQLFFWKCKRFKKLEFKLSESLSPSQQW